MDLSHTTVEWEATKRVCIRCGTAQRNADVHGDHICIALWDFDKAEIDKPLEFVLVEVAENHWLPCVLPSLLVSAGQFADAYLSLGKDELKYDWAWNELHEARGEAKLKLILAITDHAQLPEHKDALGRLGAGALEDVMGDWLLRRLEPYLPFDDRLRYALTGVRMEFEPRALQERLKWMLLA
jgi:hypothetical protein